MNRIVFEDIIRHHDVTYAQRIYPSVVFTNKMIDSGNTLSADECVSRIYKLCVSDKWNDDTLFTEQIISDYTSTLPQNFLNDVDDVEEVVGFWLSYCMGCYCLNIADVDKMLPVLMHMMYSYDGRGFVHSYIPPKSLVCKLIEHVDFSKGTLIKRCRIVQDDDIPAYIDYNTKRSQDDLLKDINRQSFYEEFCPLPDDCLMLSKYLINTRLYKEWIEIFNQIQIPFLQVQLFPWICEDHDIVELYKEIVSSPQYNNKVSRQMFMNIWFRNIVREEELYIRPLPISEYDEEVTKAFSNLMNQFNTSLNRTVERGIKWFVGGSNMREISEWAFNKSLKQNDVSEAHWAYNNVLKIIQEQVANSSTTEDLNESSSDIHYLAFVASKYISLGVSEDVKNSLLDNIWKCIEGLDFYWTTELDYQTLKDMRSFANFLVHLCNEELISNIMARFKVQYEGINATYMSDWSKKAIRESYVYCILLLMLESSDVRSKSKKELFKKITDTLLTQVRCCGLDLIIESDYYVALVVAEVVADQIIHSCKARFESELVENVYSKEIVLRVLSYSKNPVSKTVLTRLNKFRDNEWAVIRKDYLRRKQQKRVEEIDSLFAKLN